MRARTKARNDLRRRGLLEQARALTRDRKTLRSIANWLAERMRSVMDGRPRR